MGLTLMIVVLGADSAHGARMALLGGGYDQASNGGEIKLPEAGEYMTAGFYPGTIDSSDAAKELAIEIIEAMKSDGMEGAQEVMEANGGTCGAATITASDDITNRVFFQSEYEMSEMAADEDGDNGNKDGEPSDDDADVGSCVGYADPHPMVPGLMVGPWVKVKHNAEEAVITAENFNPEEGGDGPAFGLFSMQPPDEDEFPEGTYLVEYSINSLEGKGYEMWIPKSVAVSMVSEYEALGDDNEELGDDMK